MDDVTRKARAYAAASDAGFRTGGVHIAGGRARISITPDGGREMLLTAVECEMWLSGYVTGSRRTVTA